MAEDGFDYEQRDMDEQSRHRMEFLPVTAAFEAELEAMRPGFQELEARYDAASTDADRQIIANVAIDMLTRLMARHMISRVTDQLLAMLGVQNMARYFGDGEIWPNGGYVSAPLDRPARLFCLEGSEFVVPKA
jgi:hypothetical protein